MLTYGVLSVIVRFVELSVFVQNAATMLGLGVAVDYSLFINSRFREERARGARPVGRARHHHAHRRVDGGQLRRDGHPGHVDTVRRRPAGDQVAGHRCGDRGGGCRSGQRAAAAGNADAGRPTAVVFPGTDLRPARGVQERLHQAGHRDRDAPAGGGVVCGVGLLLALAIPAHRLSTFTPDARIVPADTAVRTGYDQVGEQFGIGAASPVVVVVSSDVPLVPIGLRCCGGPTAGQARGAGQRRVGELADPGVATVNPTDPLSAATAVQRGAAGPDAQQTVGHFLSADGTRMVVELIPTHDAASTQTRALVDQARGIAADLTGGGLEVDVGGETAEGMDGNAVIADSMPLVLGLMLAAIFLLLLLTFRSIALPIKAIVLNLGSVAATYGVLVVIFQDGKGSSLLGFEATGQITNFVPIVLLTLLFSLSTDYEVFLLSQGPGGDGGRLRQPDGGDQGNGRPPPR